VASGSTPSRDNVSASSNAAATGTARWCSRTGRKHWAEEDLARAHLDAGEQGEPRERRRDARAPPHQERRYRAYVPFR
jgi:hypothetical protein